MREERLQVVDFSVPHRWLRTTLLVSPDQQKPVDALLHLSAFTLHGWLGVVIVLLVISTIFLINICSITKSLIPGIRQALETVFLHALQLDHDPSLNTPAPESPY